MERMMLSRLWIVAMTAGLAALGACSSGDTAPPAPAAAVVPANAQPETVIGEELVETEVKIQSIDTKARTVTVLTADGRTETTKVPADVDLTKLKKGMPVRLGGYAKLAVKVLPAGSAQLGTVKEVVKGKAEPGQTPGRSAGMETTIVTEVASVDVAKNTVTLRRADGVLRTLEVKNADNQRKLQTLKVGDLVQIEMVEAYAVSLKPTK